MPTVPKPKMLTSRGQVRRHVGCGPFVEAKWQTGESVLTHYAAACFKKKIVLLLILIIKIIISLQAAALF